MKTILYVCAHNPYPARSGGQVDIWNRLKALRSLGHQVDLILTVKRPLADAERRALLAVVDTLTEVRRSWRFSGLFSRLPVQMACRRRLRTVELGGKRYDLALLDNEFTGEVLKNTTLSARQIIIRVHNDEGAYQRKLGETAGGPLARLYFQMEARRMARYVPSLWRQAQALWFISSDELARFEGSRAENAPHGRFLSAALDLSTAGRPPLGSMTVLFVGSLAVPLNRDAILWFLREVHPLLRDLPGYQFCVAGSTLGQALTGFRAEVERSPSVTLHCDVADLSGLFLQSSVFVSPMRHGAGVKLKTVEAVLRGIPLVATTVGAEGTGLEDQEHCRIADDPLCFAAAVQDLLLEQDAASAMRDRASGHILRLYDHAKQLGLALDALA